MTDAARCAAAHPEDPTPCDGPHDAVTVLDSTGSGVSGCEHHGARMLASLEGGRAVEGSRPAAGARVTMAADSIRPFSWYEGAPRLLDHQLSHAEVRARAEAVQAHPVLYLTQRVMFGWEQHAPGGCRCVCRMYHRGHGTCTAAAAPGRLLRVVKLPHALGGVSGDITDALTLCAPCYDAIAPLADQTPGGTT